MPHRRPTPVRRMLLVLLGAGLLVPKPLHAQTASLAMAGVQSLGALEVRLERILIIPVQGVTADELRDTYREARSGGRVHDAIDIHAPRGTPVLAVADGEVMRLHSGALGGLSLYHLDDDGRTRYYYAHLDHYAEGIHAGVRVRRGDVIGYVGDTGNAQPGDYHLHFSIARLHDRSHWWQGDNLNPFIVLRGNR